GAFGISTGLVYATGYNSTTPELVELASKMAEHGGVYASHIRKESWNTSEILTAVDEAIHIGRQASCPVQISHVKCIYPSAWGCAGQYAERVQQANEEGLQVRMDQYPYTAFASRSVNGLFPSWAVSSAAAWQDAVNNQRARLEEETRNRLDNIFGGADMIVFSSGAYAGWRLGDLATSLGKSPEDVLIDDVGRNGGGVFKVGAMSEDDVRTFMASPHTMVGTDGPGSHPRRSGTFPRIWGRYVRELGVIDKHQAVLKTSTMAARQFRLIEQNRGALRPGFFADLVIFDEDTIIDRATYEEPTLQPDGIEYVIVNGQVAMHNGQYSGALSGRVLNLTDSTSGLPMSVFDFEDGALTDDDLDKNEPLVKHGNPSYWGNPIDPSPFGGSGGAELDGDDCFSYPHASYKGPFTVTDGDGTVYVWFRWAQDNGATFLWSKYDVAGKRTVSLYIDPDNIPSLLVGHGGGDSYVHYRDTNLTLTTGVDYLIAASLDNDNQRFVMRTYNYSTNRWEGFWSHVDQPYSIDMNFEDADFLIGAGLSNGSPFLHLDGTIYHLRIYTEAHTAAEIEQVAEGMVVPCPHGHADCNGNPADGCEINISADPDHCGGCGQACNLDHASTTCAAGSCEIAGCDAGFGDCNGSATDGCETDTMANVDHCGGCGQPCDLSHASATCAAGTCEIAGCDVGFGDCNGNPTDGCETDTMANVDHCGGCALACSLDHASTTCAGGTCEIASCDAGFGDCNGNAVDGCETDTSSDADHCGGCGLSCEAPHARVACVAAICEVTTCLQGFLNCDGQPATGCETDSSDLDHCGACGAACDAGDYCVSGSCETECPTDHFACDGVCVNLQTSFLHCGACNAACVSGDECVAGQCISPGCPDEDHDSHHDAGCGGSDCDDSDSAVSPAATEVCDDEIDNDCDSLVDEDCGGGVIIGGCRAMNLPGKVPLYVLSALALFGRTRRQKSARRLAPKESRAGVS
ncbi:amidohydrolase family protein, partial [Myxococcota bacterium]